MLLNFSKGVRFDWIDKHLVIGSLDQLTNARNMDTDLHFVYLFYTMRKNLPKTLDLLIFSVYSLNFSLEFLELLKFSHNLPNISKFLPLQRCKTLRSY